MKIEDVKEFLFYYFLKHYNSHYRKCHTLTVGDNNDNFELVRFGGKGGVFPHEHSPFKVMERDKIGKGFVCLSWDNVAPFDRGWVKGEGWWLKLSRRIACDWIGANGGGMSAIPLKIIKC